MASSVNKEAREAHEEGIKSKADYFTVVRYLGPNKGYERHEEKLLPAALALATQLAKENNTNYLIYAVCGIHDTFVTGIKAPKRGATNEETPKPKRRRVRL